MREILQGSKNRISENRKLRFTAKVTNNGLPLDKCIVKIKQKKHDFLFGANCFAANKFGDEKLNHEFTLRFTDLFNFATLPFYWGGFERKRGITDKKGTMNLIDWCIENNLTMKGHPLVWYQVFPDWVEDGEDIVELTRNRLEDIIENYGNYIKWWDIVNEMTSAERADNLISKWILDKGALPVLKQAAETVIKKDSKVKLIVNDFNVWDDSFEKLMDEAVEAGIPVSAIGIQSHMHEQIWPLELVWKICERYSKYGIPIHFTELSVLSGKAQGKVNFYSDDNVWLTGDEYDDIQKEYVKDFYTLLFSHPMVEAITWWDIKDGAWLKAPSGLLREDLTPKKAYNALHKLIKGDWWTEIEGMTDLTGQYGADVFYGEYDVSVFHEGHEKNIRVNLSKDKGKNQEILIEFH